MSEIVSILLNVEIFLFAEAWGHFKKTTRKEQALHALDAILAGVKGSESWTITIVTFRFVTEIVKFS